MTKKEETAKAAKETGIGNNTVDKVQKVTQEVKGVTRKKLDQAKKRVSPETLVREMVKKFLKKAPKMNNVERFIELGKILIAAAILKNVSKIKGWDKIMKLKATAEKKQAKEEDKKKPKKKKDKSDEVKKTQSDKEETSEDEENEEEEAEDEKSEVEKLAEIPDINERVVKVTEQMVEEETTGLHCWDWCAKVYKAANVKRDNLFASFNDYEGKNCGEHCAKDTELNMIKPGAHIFINNRNKYDIHGNHSVIFLGWVNRKKRIAQTAGCPFTNKPAVIHKHENLFDKPVTAIANPI